MARFAIGDIHGCFYTMKKLIEEELKISKSDKVYFLGDYIDRGPESKKVLDYLMALKEKNYKIVTLLGNHEVMLLDSGIDYDQYSNWMYNGGNTTLVNFGIDDYYKLGPFSYNKIPAKYIKFLKSCKFYHDSERKFIFVHAGFNFNIKDPFTDKYMMVWTRDENYDGSKVNNKIIVHGHSAVTLEEIRSRIQNKKAKTINLDAGCVYKQYPGLANLAALNLDTWQLYSVSNIDS